jgi:hypothetical protein
LPVEFVLSALYRRASGSGDFRLAEYKAYIVGRDGHFIGYQPLVCADDYEAIEKAKRLVDTNDVELWSGPRFVTQLKAKNVGNRT